MPPRKRQKTGNTAKSHAPQTMADMSPTRLLLRDWIAQVFQGRHGHPEKLKWPLLDGGSFLDVVQRVWADEDLLIQDSITMVKKLGIIDSSATEEDFQNKFLAFKDQ